MEKIKLKYKSYSIMAYHWQGETQEKILFLHGGALDYAMMSWEETIGYMDKKYDIYAVDFLGFGESDKPRIEYSNGLFVDFIYNILMQLNITKTHMVGLSMGAGNAIGFALKYPEMVDKLVLLDAWVYVKKMPLHRLSSWFVNSSLNEKSYTWFAKSKKLVKWGLAGLLIGDKKSMPERLVNDLYNLIKDPECNIAWISLQRYEMGRKKLTTDLVSNLSELKMPVLIVNGEKDPVVSVKSAVAASKVIPDCRLHIMKGCRHWPQKERPEEFAAILCEYLLKPVLTK
jgi:pimeloyl-ACP methyl ester carboxylesterase